MIDSLKNIQAEEPHEKLDRADNCTFVDQDLLLLDAGFAFHAAYSTSPVPQYHLREAFITRIDADVTHTQVSNWHTGHVESVSRVRGVFI